MLLTVYFRVQRDYLWSHLSVLVEIVFVPCLWVSLLTKVRTGQPLFRYEHSKLSDEEIAELVRESLAAVGLKVCGK